MNWELFRGQSAEHRRNVLINRQIGRDAFVQNEASVCYLPSPYQAPLDVLEQRIPIEMWPTKIDCALAKLGVRTWRDLAGLSQRHILIKTNLGKKSVAYIRKRMNAVGVEFDPSQPRPIPNRVLDLKPVCGVYFLRCHDFIKIGSGGNVRKRATQLSDSIPYTLEPLGWIRTVDRESAFVLEKSLHKRFADQRYRYEWFKDSAMLRAFIRKHTGSLWREAA